LELFGTTHDVESTIVDHNKISYGYTKEYQEYGVMFNQSYGLYAGASSISSGETEVIALHRNNNDSDIGLIDGTSHKSFYTVMAGYDNERPIRLMEEDYSGLLYGVGIQGGKGQISSTNDITTASIAPNDISFMKTNLRFGYIYHKWQSDPIGGFNLTLGLNSSYEYMEAKSINQKVSFAPRLKKAEILSDFFVNLEFLY
jgi:hypothetical protein